MDRLYRSLDDRILAGVAGGMAEAWDLDPSIVRLAWIIMTPVTAGFAILVYVILAMVVPEGPTGALHPPAGSVAGVDPAAPHGGAGPGAPPPAGPGTAPAPSPAAPATGAGWQPGAASWREERRAEQARRRAERAAWRADRRAARGGRPDDSAILAGVVLIVLGAVFFASQLLPAFNWALAWPVALIALGALLIIRAARPSS